MSSSDRTGSYTASSSEEEEITPTTTIPPKPDSAPTTTPASSDEEEDRSDDSDSDSGSAEDSDSSDKEEDDVDPSIKSSIPLPLAAPYLKKKPEDNHENIEGLKKKPEDNHESREGQKRQLFQRIWSEDDEIAVLRGLIAYRSKNGGNLPSSSDIHLFLHSIEKELHINPTKDQLVKKIRSLKHKFTNPSTRTKSGLCYDLSKKVWEEYTNTNQPCNIKTRKRKKLKDEKEEIAAAVVTNDERPTYLFLREALFKVGSEYTGALDAAKSTMELIDPAESTMLEEQYKKLRVMETMNRIVEMGIMKKTLKLVLDA